MQQPTLAPAPIPHMSQQDAAEQTLRAHLLGQIGGPPQATASPSNVTSPNGTADSSSPTSQNIDPAISGNANSAAAQQQQQQQQQSQPLQQVQQQPSVVQQHPQQSMPQQQQPMHTQQQQQPQQPQGQQHVMSQHMPQQMQQIQMQQMPQHPQSPSNVQTLQMGQGVPMDMHNNQSHSGNEESEQPKPRGGGKRELSTSKRAAQNRAAQRAFRQRKEGYIKKLEEQVRDFATMQESYKQIQNENYQLRDYIISLQSRLIESQGEDAVPPAPAVLVHPSPPLVLVDTSSTSGASGGGGGMMHQASQQVSHPLPQQQPPPPQHVPVQSQSIQIHPAPISSAPTANMGVGHPSIPATPVSQSILAVASSDIPQQPAAGGPQKRAHEDNTPSDHSFLQSIAQAADTGGTNSSSTSTSSFIASNTPSTASGKAISPAAKRVKGEKVVELKTEPENLNGA